jgi:3-dehydroquinate dehydratase/shikimate dehydrogenase
VLVVSLISESLEILAARAIEAFASGADAVELRADFLDDPDPRRARAAVRGLAIYTLRRPGDGGRWTGTEDDRLALLGRAGEAGFEFVDVEWDSGLAPTGLGTKCILSHHDLSGVSEDLEGILADMEKAGPALVKAVCRCGTLKEELRLLGIQKKLGPKAACFGMGPSALVSRVLGVKFGSPACYASLRAGEKAAPGQPVLADLREIYRIDSVGRETLVYGIAGDPLGHSRSPAFHNRAFQEAGIDAVYLPFATRDFDALWARRNRLELKGLSVTLPHKEAALGEADKEAPAASQAGAANTLTRTREGWRADNTDVPAVLDALEQGGIDPSGSTAVVLGAGGAARAVCQALRSLGASITVAARSPARAERLARVFGAKVVPLQGLDPSSFGLVVNATPVGMAPESGALLLDPSLLRAGTSVFDVIYLPEETALLKAARERGCRTVGGESMFRSQAGRQQALWAQAREG